VLSLILCLLEAPLFFWSPLNEARVLDTRRYARTFEGRALCLGTMPARGYQKGIRAEMCTIYQGTTSWNVLNIPREYELKCAQYIKGTRAGMCSIYQGNTS
jgi:hypothetical protein